MTSPRDVGPLMKSRFTTQVKSGGHAYNIGFSSTTGVQISLVRFNSVTVNRAARTVTLGTGLTWDQVYQRLEPYGVMVAGARLPGIGQYRVTPHLN